MLDLLTVQLGDIVSELGGLEMSKHDGAQFGTDSGQASTKIFICFVVGSDVEGRGMAIVQVVKVGMDIGHAIYY